jgi:predicted amidohydrolase YtcJ
VWNDDDLFAEVEKFDRMGLGVTGHATGDAANRQVIDAVAYVKEKHGEKGRHQLGPATMIHPEDIPRLKELDVTPEFSPVFWYPSGFPGAQKAQLGDDRMNGWYPINSVARSGGRVTLATAIKAMTLNSAYLMNQEDTVGSIEVGKRADMVVLDKNLF